jgi:hypothetical protein
MITATLRRNHVGNIVRWLLAGVCGTLLGIGSVVLAARFIGNAAFIENGPWHTSLATGSREAGPYLRLVVAGAGLLALNRSEAIYFFADTDSNGDKLNGACTYQVAGQLPQSRWWSLTVYGADHYLIPNNERRYSASPANSGGSAVNQLEVVVGPGRLDDQAGDNWIPTANVAHFQLTLRLYQPGAAAATNPAAISLPSIVKEGC